MKKFFVVLWACLMPLAASADHIREGQFFYGGYYTDDNRGGSEYLLLGDGNGWGLELIGTDRYCIKPGDSYATMRSYIGSNRQGVQWWVDEICNGDGGVRVCVESRSGRVACSTYWDNGWVRFR